MKPYQPDSQSAHQTVGPTELERLVTCAPDQELILAIELTFRCFVRPADLSLLRTEDSDVLGDPIRLLVPTGQLRTPKRYITIHPEYRTLIRVLLPKSGHLFSDADPYGRLQRFASKMGLRLSRKCAKNSCILHAFAAGWSADAIAAMSGMRCEVLRHHHYLPIQYRDAKPYWRFSYDLERIAALPRHCRGLPETLSRRSARTAARTADRRARAAPEQAGPRCQTGSRHRAVLHRCLANPHQHSGSGDAVLPRSARKPNKTKTQP